MMADYNKYLVVEAIYLYIYIYLVVCSIPICIFGGVWQGQQCSSALIHLDLRFQLSPRSLCEESGLPIHGGSAGCGGGSTVSCTHQVKSSNMIKSYQFIDNWFTLIWIWIKTTADYCILQTNLRWQLIPIHIENNPWWFFWDLGAILAQPFWLGFWFWLHVASYLHILHRCFCGLRGGWWCDLLLAGGFSGVFFAACWGPSCEKKITW